MPEVPFARDARLDAAAPWSSADWPCGDGLPALRPADAEHRAAGVAHDLTNLLTVIAGFGDLLVTELGPDDPRHALAAQVAGAAERAGALARQLLAGGPRAYGRAEGLDLNAAVRDLSVTLQLLLGPAVGLTVALAPDAWPAGADAALVARVLVNLCTNARDALAGRGSVTVGTGNVVLRGALARDGGEVRPGPYVLLRVSDTGCGMTPEVRARLFEPYFTTKGPGRGTGLGLATVYELVREAGGYVAVDSEEGRGSTFKVYLPRAGAVPSTN